VRRLLPSHLVQVRIGGHSATPVWSQDRKIHRNEHWELTPVGIIGSSLLLCAFVVSPGLVSAQTGLPAEATTSSRNDLASPHGGTRNPADRPGESL
jgi:hypothetical protein